MGVGSQSHPLTFLPKGAVLWNTCKSAKGTRAICFPSYHIRPLRQQALDGLAALGEGGAGKRRMMELEGGREKTQVNSSKSLSWCADVNRKQQASQCWPACWKCICIINSLGHFYPSQSVSPGFPTPSTFCTGHTSFLKPKMWAAVIPWIAKLGTLPKGQASPAKEWYMPKDTTLGSSLTGGPINLWKSSIS